MPYLAQIYAAPDDDAPRQVFADVLTERGDPRGEFITLQLARARGQATPAQLTRERELAAPEEHRIAWARPVSKGGTCHLSRGFPDELMIEPKQFDGLLGHPAVSTLHTVTGFDTGVSDQSARTFLLHPTAARLRSISGMTQGLLESLEAPIAWPSVGLAFAPTRAHRDRLVQLPELTIRMQLKPLTAECFGGLTSLKRLKVGRAADGAFEPLTGLERLEVSDWRSTNHWGTELAWLPRLEQLKLGATTSTLRLEGLRLKRLECWTSSDLDLDALLAGLPELKELRLWCGTEAATKQTVEKVIAAARLTQLQFVSAGVFEFTNPGRPDATLELRGARLEEHAAALAVVPPHFVTSVLVRPHELDPWLPIGALSAKGVEAIRRAAKVPVEFAWY